MSMNPIRKREDLNLALTQLNAEINHSLSIQPKIKNQSETLAKAEKKAEISNSDIDTISSIARIMILLNQNLTDQEIASKLLKELSNSHPNRLIKLICKKMIKQKWGIKNEAE